MMEMVVWMKMICWGNDIKGSEDKSKQPKPTYNVTIIFLNYHLDLKSYFFQVLVASVRYNLIDKYLKIIKCLHIKNVMF